MAIAYLSGKAIALSLGSARWLTSGLQWAVCFHISNLSLPIIICQY
jgi:hypothetical protein